MDVRVGLWRKLCTEELMLLNCGVGEDSWESLGLQGDPTVHPKGDQSWIFIGTTDAEADAPIFGHLMRRADSLEKTLMLGKIEGGRKRGRQRMLGTLALESSFCYLNLIYGCISCIYWTGQDFLHESQFMWFTNTAYDQEKIMGRMLVIEDF